MIRLWAEPGRRIADYYRYFSEQDALMKYICAPVEGTLCTRQLQLSEPIIRYLTGGECAYPVYFLRRIPGRLT